ncbi:methyltransferase domain-containing protein [Seiridium cupressi]
MGSSASSTIIKAREVQGFLTTRRSGSHQSGRAEVVPKLKVLILPSSAAFAVAPGHYLRLDCDCRRGRKRKSLSSLAGFPLAGPFPHQPHAHAYAYALLQPSPAQSSARRQASASTRPAPSLPLNAGEVAFAVASGSGSRSHITLTGEREKKRFCAGSPDSTHTESSNFRSANQSGGYHQNSLEPSRNRVHPREDQSAPVLVLSVRVVVAWSQYQRPAALDKFCHKPCVPACSNYLLHKPALAELVAITITKDQSWVPMVTASPTTPLQAPWFAENGRYYGTFKPGQYMLPVDENELDRLDIMHKFHTVARRDDAYGGLHEAPISSPSPRVLDLGCGTGIWAIDMADRYQYGKVIGLDLNYTQPESIPATLEFRRQDIEEPHWGLEPDSFDLVHVQMLAGSITNWPALYQNIYRHLKPGTGMIEHVEINFDPQSNDSSLPPDSRLRLWFNEMRSAYEQARRPIVLEPSTETWLKQAGFEDIKRNIKEIPYHPWPSSEHQKEVGRWFNLGMVHGIEAMSMAPLTRHRNYTKEQVTALLAEVKREICTRQFRSHCVM